MQGRDWELCYIIYGNVHSEVIVGQSYGGSGWMFGSVTCNLCFKHTVTGLLFIKCWTGSLTSVCETYFLCIECIIFYFLYCTESCNSVYSYNPEIM